MKVGDLHSNREAALYPTAETIVASQVVAARLSYPQHIGSYDDMTLLAFLCITLTKNLAERTKERNHYSAELSALREAALSASRKAAQA